MFCSISKASEITTEIIEKVRESVVVVQGSTQKKDISVPSNTCAGAIINKEGHVLTNYHCVHKQQDLRLYYHDNSDWNDYQVEIIGIDPLADLALLKVPDRKKEVPYLRFATKSEIKIGQEVFALGHPMGMVFSLSKGIISSNNRYARHPYVKAIQTDAAINKGSSGGPLVNSEGKIVGIATMLVTTTGVSAGVGIAVRADIVRNSIAQMRTTGRADRPALGIMIIPLYGQKIQQDKLLKEFPQNTRVIPNTYGLLMTDEKYVDKEIPKDLKAWDTIIGINNTLINNGVEFSDELINHHIGSRIDVSIIRNKRFLRIKDIIVKVLHVDANKMYDAELRR